ncbi:MAG: hypothetical protein O7D31_08910 [Alphaproteobacteria bacterium]|nr:hypothetical protein [Alphaproteobacteria bacterium]
MPATLHNNPIVPAGGFLWGRYPQAHRRGAGMAPAHSLIPIPGPSFSTDIAYGVWEGATVTYVAMQVAYYMGFSRVILVGVDHHFETKGAPHKEIVSEGNDTNHFDNNYFGKGFRWNLPDLATSELAYSIARLQFESDNREIIDATVGGKLTVFRKIEFTSLFSRSGL